MDVANERGHVKIAEYLQGDVSILLLSEDIALPNPQTLPVLRKNPVSTAFIS